MIQPGPDPGRLRALLLPIVVVWWGKVSHNEFGRSGPACIPWQLQKIQTLAEACVKFSILRSPVVVLASPQATLQATNDRRGIKKKKEGNSNVFSFYR